MTTIADLAEDRTVEGVFAVTKKERRRTRAGASYLALELVDASGRVEARVWNDVDLLDQRFDEGDAVRVLGRVERFGGTLQVQVRTVEAADDADSFYGIDAPAPRRLIASCAWLVRKRIATRNVITVPKKIHQGNSIFGSHHGVT